MSDKPDKERHLGEADGWSIVSTLVAGPVVWGAVGYLIDKATDSSLWTPIGLAVGFVAGFYIVYVRHVRS
ncbi:AtpZ/AtpI family protein [Goodfellowiella coeruleoviolacea]|uniref:ATP synthase protein I n=1 Tax=Goodfellowiella coeruleoviolacea TaxID=334858 RepID=A0AAE3GEW2_9PSEU|nr:AtpZ/AtpI family protein [Goodfellowiella coeruleoviolacea]MCP2166936.1 ATP synthase protein I [Goodfellowiella coeruleoviolacea]